MVPEEVSSEVRVPRVAIAVFCSPAFALAHFHLCCCGCARTDRRPQGRHSCGDQQRTLLSIFTTELFSLFSRCFSCISKCFSYISRTTRSACFVFSFIVRCRWLPSRISQIIFQAVRTSLNLPHNPQRCRSHRRWNSHFSHRSSLPGLPHEWNRRQRRQTASRNCSDYIPVRHPM